MYTGYSPASTGLPLIWYGATVFPASLVKVLVMTLRRCAVSDMLVWGKACVSVFWDILGRKNSSAVTTLRSVFYKRRIVRLASP